MKSSEPSMSVAISKHEREGLSGISTNPDSKMSCSHPSARAGHEEHRIERDDKREREQERLERLGDLATPTPSRTPLRPHRLGARAGYEEQRVKHERGDIEARARGTQWHQHQLRLENDL